MLSNARDIAIIILAFQSIVVGALMIYLLLQIRSLVSLLRDEIKPLLESANHTADTVRGTADFVSSNLVQPIVRANSFVAGIRGGLKALIGRR